MPPPFEQMRVVPILTVERVEDAVPVAEALLEGGLTVVEVTLRNPARAGHHLSRSPGGCRISRSAPPPCCVRPM